MIDHASSGDREVLRLLRQHPKVTAVQEDTSAGISFRQGEWHRSVVQGDSQTELYGLVELMDNNPLVCADQMSIPTPIGVLAAIALGPLIVSGLLYEEPTILASNGDDKYAIDELLRREGWEGGAILSADEKDLGGLLAATVIAAIRTPSRLEDIDDLYEERFGRSFFVHRDEISEWHVDLVRGSQNALFRLRIVPDEPYSLLTIQAMADRKGKCGAGALIHAMNVMAGFEESLGLA